MYDWTDDLDINQLDNVQAYLDTCKELTEKLEEMNKRLNKEIDKTGDDPVYRNLRCETDPFC